MNSPSVAFLIHYRHNECTVEPGVEWYDLWSSHCNGQCPACGMKDIEPIEWQDAESCFMPDESR
jgi:hypothetical protein